MLTKYIQAAMNRCEYEILDDKTFYGHIPGFDGVWANESTLEACRQELQEALEDWILLGVSMNYELPPVDGIELTYGLCSNGAGWLSSIESPGIPRS